MEGHAVEARLYAEDPFNNFLPSIGKIDDLKASGRINRKSGWRIDTGYKPPTSVGIYYDPMIAKVIGYGDIRETAINRTIQGIDDIACGPIQTNSGTLFACLNHSAFEEEKLSTHFFDLYQNEIIPYNIKTDERAFFLAAIFLSSGLKNKCDDDLELRNDVFSTLDGWRLNLDKSSVFTFSKNGKAFPVKVLRSHDNFIRIQANEKKHVLYFNDYPAEMSILEALNYYNAWEFERDGDKISMTWNYSTYQIEIYRPNSDLLNGISDAITAPMPGKVIALNVAAGDTVSKDDALVVMEAMKMEQTLSAPRDGIVAEIGAGVGELVTDGALLVRLEEEKK